jgi:formylglycine-generating enzyme required for sulfatase activity/tRNA A-37 threonylcarbamoyl transferase component Bud32
LLLFRRYKVLRELGRGGMGVVVLAHDTALDIPVAVKVLPTSVSSDSEGIVSLRKEVLRGMALMHPGIVRTHNFEKDEGGAGIVMEYVEGSDLTTLKGQQPGGCLDPDQILPWIEQLCAVLDYAHKDARIVHRDLKPRNVMLDRTGRIKVADFGIAAVVSESKSRHSMEGRVSGTLSYMSPQQAEGKRPSYLDDIHALGATIYELLTAKPPFFRGNQGAIMHQIVHVVPPSMAERREDLDVTGKAPLPPQWEETVAACLAKEATDRPQSAGAVLARLKACGLQSHEAVEATMQTIRVPSGSVNRLSSLDEGVVGTVVEINLPGGEKMKFCYCPPGSFTMGSPKTEKWRRNDEGPVPVRITKGFWMAQTECTQGQWEALMGSNPSRFKGATRPVEQVSWDDTRAFIAKLNQNTTLPAGWKFALPSEAQWECACRAGTPTAFAFGASLTSQQANFNGTYPYGTSTKGPNLQGTAPVGSYQPNGWGLYDMHGNVWEWCGDWYAEEQFGGVDPTGAASGANRVERGGSWFSSAADCRAALRGSDGPSNRIDDLGFRPALVTSK